MWKINVNFLTWEKRLDVEEWNFSQTMTELQALEWAPEILETNVLTLFEKQWQQVMKDWKQFDDKPNKALQSIVFFMACLPLRVVQKLTRLEIRLINFVRYYNNLSLLEMDGTQSKEEIVKDVPLGEKDRRKHYDRRYKRSTWWLCYGVFERLLGVGMHMSNDKGIDTQLPEMHSLY